MQTEVVMPIALHLLLLALFILLCLPAAAVAAAADAATRAEIKAFYDKLARAQEAKDITTVMAAMAADPILNIGSDENEWYVGREALAKGYADFFGQAKAISLSFSIVSVGRSGDVAWVAGKAPVSVTLADGTTQSFTGRFTSVLLREKDGWRMVQSHFSAPADSQARAK
jgi:ketosteroid isomerase-like protein